MFLYTEETVVADFVYFKVPLLCLPPLLSKVKMHVLRGGGGEHRLQTVIAGELNCRV